MEIQDRHKAVDGGHRDLTHWAPAHSKRTFLVLFARLITSRVAQNDQWNQGMDFDVDEWVLLVEVVFPDDEG